MKRWMARGAWGLGGAAVGGVATFVWLTMRSVPVEMSFNLRSVWTWDTIGTWGGLIATVFIAVVAAVYSERQRREAKRRAARDALVLASEVQFRVRPVQGSNEFWTRWRVVLWTVERAPATAVEVLADGVPLGSPLPILRKSKEEPWAWPVMQDLDMTRPTQTEEVANAFIRSDVRERVEVRFTVSGHRFSRTAEELKPLGRDRQH